eukprot:COSAG03_NODE_338_length_8851_cov_33.536106_5_plen_217_part_00
MLAGAAALLFGGAGLRSGGSSPAGVSTVPICVFGQDFSSVEELLNRSTACLVQGLESDLHQAVIKQWTVEQLRRLPQAVLKLRVTEGDAHTRVMRYNKMGPADRPESSFRSKLFGLVWPREAYLLRIMHVWLLYVDFLCEYLCAYNVCIVRSSYDMWEFKDATIEDVINPRRDDWYRPLICFSPSLCVCVCVHVRVACPLRCVSLCVFTYMCVLHV